ncbi:MAG: NAD(P)H-dependent oxidoreductase subunit E [Oscillospiraceae bacterium]|jgi:NADH-quinone oxidoreductase subunit E|nr:NAD(P)H-dependent oxidoreductase subunit E [Oscillospiraceae bacterium]
MSQKVFATKFENVCAVLEKYGNDPHRLVAILQEIQDAYSYLPEDIMAYVATALRVTPGAVYGVATFYSHFTLQPKGKYVIRVCDGTACHVKKASEIISVIEKELGLNEKKKTSDDLLFTLEIVACLGACGLAPVVMVNEEVHGSMNAEKTAELIKKLREEEGRNG